MAGEALDRFLFQLRQNGAEMSAQEETMEMGTQPVAEHAWLQNLVGEWKTESEYQTGPDQPTMKASGREIVKSIGGLWAFTEGVGEMTEDCTMTYFSTLGYDVSFKEYRGCWFASMSSHLWKYVGKLSPDKKTMTLDCEGPDMVNDGQTANYRDVIELIDANHRTMTSYAQGEDGEYHPFMKVTYTRI